MKDLKQIEQYTSYPKYKDSGIEWLGKVPEHWKIGRLKNSIKSVSNGVWGNEPQFDENDIVCLRVADFNRDDLTINVKNLTVRNVKPNDKNKRLIEFGDLLLEKSGGGDLQPVGFVVRFTHNFPAICSNFIARIQTNELSDSNYFKYVHNTLYNLRINKRSIKQTTGIQNLDQELYFNEVVPFPPLKEQKEIADFLDHKTSQIDSIIKDKERLIECLKEYRQSIITEAVTKGLSPETTKMKDSGIEWLGEVPEHWEIKKIKYLFKQIDERNNSEDAELLSLYTDIGVKPRKELEQKGNKAQTVIDYKIVKKNDIVVNKLLAWMGAISISDYEGVCSPDYDVYRKIDEEIEPRFYHYYFRSHYFKGDCYRFGKGIMMMRWRIYPEQFKSIFVVKPPYDEQVQIVNYVERIYTEYENLIEAINNQIKKLHEFRESLIYEAVTGKIDVRGFRKGE